MHGSAYTSRVRTSTIAQALATTLLALGCHDVTTPEQFQELVDASRECGAGDGCVLAGAGECTCDTPVRASESEAVAVAAAEVECEGATITCSGQDNLRCEAGRCISDQSH
jgi:hypothetical protein